MDFCYFTRPFCRNKF